MGVETDTTASFFKAELRYVEDTGHLFWRNRVQRNGSKAGHKNGDGYIMVERSGLRFRAHRIVWLLHNGAWPVLRIDDVNGVRDDNRIENLREATHAQNLMNRRGYGRLLKGVTVSRGSSRFQARIFANGKQNNLGTFTTELEAHQAYLAAAKAAHGAFAWEG